MKQISSYTPIQIWFPSGTGYKSLPLDSSYMQTVKGKLDYTIETLVCD